MKIYQFNWVEMHGGFDQQVNIEASSKKKAEKIFEKEVGFKFDETFFRPIKVLKKAQTIHFEEK